jgi:hypothetical protein
LFLDLPDMPMRGLALIRGVTAVPPPAQAAGCPVTGVFRRALADLIALHLAPFDVLTVTPGHKLFSESRNDWVPAGKVVAGEVLHGLDGPVSVEFVDPAGEARVFNLEVSGVHRYFVGDARVEAHNTECPPVAGAVGKGGGKESVRVRHFTNSKGAKGIESEGVITASDQNKVFTVKAQGKPGSPRDVEEALGIKRGRGNNYVEFDAKPGEFETVKNSKTGATETVFDGDVDLTGRNATFHKNR